MCNVLEADGFHFFFFLNGDIVFVFADFCSTNKNNPFFTSERHRQVVEELLLMMRKQIELAGGDKKLQTF